MTACRCQVKLDAAMKDWIVVMRHVRKSSDGRKNVLSDTVVTPAMTRDSDVLLPMTLWPFDHAMVSANLVLGKARQEPRRTGILRFTRRVSSHLNSNTDGTDTDRSSDSGTTDSDTHRSNVCTICGPTTSHARRFSALSALLSALSAHVTMSRLVVLLCERDVSILALKQRTHRERRRTPKFHRGVLTDSTRRPCSAANDMTQITVITMLMGALELDERQLLATFAVAMVVVITFGILVLNDDHNPAVAYGGAFAFLCFSGFCLWQMRRFSRKIESLDKFAWRFDDVRKKLLDGVPADERGPQSMKKMQVIRQQSGDDVLANLVRAKELLESFGRDVFEPATALELNDSEKGFTVRYNIKGQERAFEKARWDYHGDGARVCDLLRGCIICPGDSIVEVRIVCAYLQELEEKGVIEIVQIKNRCV
jgi:hypothetical protein